MVLDREHLRRYLYEKQGLAPEDFEDDTLLFSSGLIDSFSMVDLSMFIENTGGLRVHPADVPLDSFDSIERILAFVEARCAWAAGRDRSRSARPSCTSPSASRGGAMSALWRISRHAATPCAKSSPSPC